MFGLSSRGFLKCLEAGPCFKLKHLPLCLEVINLSFVLSFLDCCSKVLFSFINRLVSLLSGVY